MTRPKGAIPLAVVAAGGTGGHMFPAEALARELTARGWRVVLATDARGAAYAEHFPAEMRIALEAATFKRGDLIGGLFAGLKILRGIGQARTAFYRIRPSVVIGFGGYPSYPAVMAARSMNLPCILHEQNAVLGRSNRALADKVGALVCGFPILERVPPRHQHKVEPLGNPVRPAIRALYDQAYPTPDGTLTLLITGGSQGARLLSETVPVAIAALPDPLKARLRVMQQTREESLDFARETYAKAGISAEVAPFFSDMAERLAAAHLVIGRAGASTCSELAMAGRPAILIPLKIAADDHQSVNARVLVEAGAADSLSEDELTAETLTRLLETRLSAPLDLQARAAAAKSVAQPMATRDLADLVQTCVASA